MAMFVPVSADKVVNADHIVTLRRIAAGGVQIKTSLDETITLGAGAYSDAILDWAVGEGLIFFQWDNAAPND